MTYTQEHAMALAKLARTEIERCRWLGTFGARVSEEQVALSQAYWDEQASRAVTQGLADAVCAEYPEIV